MLSRAQGMVCVHAFEEFVVGLKLSRERVLGGEQIEPAIDLAAGRVRVEEIPGVTSFCAIED